MFKNQSRKIMNKHLLRMLIVGLVICGPLIFGLAPQAHAQGPIQTITIGNLQQIQSIVANQTCPNWCWAASSEMLARSQGVMDVPQEEFVRRIYHNGQPPIPVITHATAAQYRPLLPCLPTFGSFEPIRQAITGVYPLPNGDSVYLSGAYHYGVPTNVAGMITSIQEGRPFIFAWQGHAWVAYGIRFFYTSPTTVQFTEILLIDPLHALAPNRPQFTSFVVGVHNFGEINGTFELIRVYIPVIQPPGPVQPGAQLPPGVILPGGGLLPPQGGFAPGGAFLPPGGGGGALPGGIPLPGGGAFVPPNAAFPGGAALPPGVIFPGGLTLPGGGNLPGGALLPPPGQPLPPGLGVPPQGYIPPQTTLPNPAILPPGAIFPGGIVLPPGGGFLPGGAYLPPGAGGDLPGGQPAPGGGTVLPPNTLLPGGTVLPPGVILPGGLDITGGVYFPGGVIIPIYGGPIVQPTDIYLPPLTVLPAPIAMPPGGLWLPGGGTLPDLTPIPPGWFLGAELPAGTTLQGGAIFPQGGAELIRRGIIRIIIGNPFPLDPPLGHRL
jgi:hypothetical protein